MESGGYDEGYRGGYEDSRDEGFGGGTQNVSERGSDPGSERVASRVADEGRGVGYAEGYGSTKDSFTIGEVVERLRPEFPTLSVSKIRYLERRRLITLTRTRGGYRLFSPQDIELLRYILTLQDKEYLPLKVIKKRIEGGGALTSGDSTGDLSRVLEERTYTREELSDTLEADARFVDELISVGVIGRSGELTQRDAEIARMALEMAKYSIQPRHLRGIMAAVDREAALFKQVVNPELRSGDEGRVAEAVNKARHLAAVDSRMKELMMANVIDTFAP